MLRIVWPFIVMILLYVGSFALLATCATRPAWGEEAPERHGAQTPAGFEVHSMLTPDGLMRCVVVREVRKVMGGHTVSLAISCFPNTDPKLQPIEPGEGF